jgi:UDP-N-acetylmuramate: L-alanyl-gamma-D-glutamyl-meso-diaminopimelate ligase
LEQLKKIYLAGICGTGMAALAAMLKSQGHEVCGSDENAYPPMSTFLRERDIPVFRGFQTSNLAAARPDLVVIGNALSRGNPEVEFVLNEKIDFISMPAALRRFFIRGKYSCVVTGTHGKTTTTSLLAWILESAGMQPSFFAGGIPENFGQGFQLKDGRHFIAEGDEYDSAFFDKGPKFLHYQANLLMINNIEFDHADIYKNLEEVKTAFRRLINIVPGNGHIIANADDPVVAGLVQKSFSNVHTFGFSENAEWRAEELQFSGNGTTFSISRKNEPISRIFSPLMGKFNITNVLAAFVAADILGVSHVQIRAAIASFQGVKRRMTKLGEVNEILVFEDFAHHATAVKETIAGVRLCYPDRRIWAIFEPRTASAKRKVFEQSYYNAFDGADQVVFAAMHKPEKVPEPERISIANIVKQLCGKKIAARCVASNQELLLLLPREVRQGDLFLFMSNGDFGDIPGRFVKALAKIHEQ